MFVCPDCRKELEKLKCPLCKVQYLEKHGIPILISQDKKYQDAQIISDIYDNNFYTDNGAWHEEGFDEEYMKYALYLLPNLDKNNKNFLDVGCGDGTLLTLVPTELKFGIDLSLHAIKLAKKKTNAVLCVSLGERLPFPSDYFDLLTNIGSLEHFLDDIEGLKEMSRVLKDNGYSVVVIPNKNYYKSKTYIKHIINNYFYREFRPFLFFGKLSNKILKKIWPTKRIRTDTQPIMRDYSLNKAKKMFEQNGLEVLNVLPHEAAKSSNKQLSLRFTSHFIFFLRKQSNQRKPDAFA